MRRCNGRPYNLYPSHYGYTVTAGIIIWCGVVVVVCFVNSMVTWVWPWGQFHLSESEGLLGMSMSRGLFGMILSGGLPESGRLLSMSMFMGLLGMSGFWFCNQQDSFTNMIADRSA